jgi:hypothetical protein
LLASQINLLLMVLLSLLVGTQSSLRIDVVMQFTRNAQSQRGTTKTLPKVKLISCYISGNSGLPRRLCQADFWMVASFMRVNYWLVWLADMIIKLVMKKSQDKLWISANGLTLNSMT